MENSTRKSERSRARVATRDRAAGPVAGAALESFSMVGISLTGNPAWRADGPLRSKILALAVG
jgi:hypothetical protein